MLCLANESYGQGCAGNGGTPPTASYTAADNSSSCLLNTYQFTNTSTPGSGTITIWFWDFGDGHTSNQYNPTNTYATYGDFDVKLTVINSLGCSATYAKILTVAPKLVSKFSGPPQSCPNVPVTFTDQSIKAAGYTIKEWKWSFGDNTGDTTITNGASPTHTYARPGTYKVSLQVTTTANCVSDIFSSDIIILNAPAPDFILPDACVTDVVQFMDATTVTGSNNPPVLYRWDFGDAANSSAANPNTSTAKNPFHRYSRPDVYNVTLTVNGQNGCGTGSITKQFTVNGALPVAGFTVQNSTTLCSGSPVTLVNTSTVSFGHITRLDVYYNYVDSPTVVKQFLRSRGEIPANGILPPRGYAQFTSPISKNFTIRMIAYSGASCISVPVDQVITIYVKPVISLAKPTGGVCQDAGPVKIIENKGIFTGTGVFTGTGISPAGLFNPAVTGPGTFPINYIFTSANTGCTYSETFNINVSPRPVIALVKSIGVSEGETTRLNPTVSGSNLQFLWSPAKGVSDVTVRNPIFTPTESTTYTLTVRSGSASCEASAQVTVTVLKTLVIPNAFTPNHDGVNDTWDIKYLDSYAGATIEVFSRYGKRVFRSTDYGKPWDGTLNGAVLPVGVYYYVITTGRGREPMTGSLTILK